MVASPVSRYCACGCGRTIDHMHMNTKYLPECRKVVEAKRSATRMRSVRRSSALCEERVRLKRKSVNPRQNYVKMYHEDTPNRRQNFCRICCGMPWARVPDRVTEGREGYQIPVSLDGYHCRECGEPYAPEPPPQPLEVLISSAGLTAKEGELQGHSIERGFSFTVSKRKNRDGKV